VAVSATGAAFLQNGIEDIGFLTLMYPNNVICHVHTSGQSPQVRELTIVGDRKMAVWDDMDNLEPIRYYDKGVVADAYVRLGISHDPARWTITIPKLKLFEPLLRQNQEFVRVRAQPKEPVRTANRLPVFAFSPLHRLHERPGTHDQCHSV